MKRLLVLFMIAVAGWFAVGRHLPQADPRAGLPPAAAAGETAAKPADGK